jgi:hypothetical protein
MGKLELLGGIPKQEVGNEEKAGVSPNPPPSVNSVARKRRQSLRKRFPTGDWEPEKERRNPAQLLGTVGFHSNLRDVLNTA